MATKRKLQFSDYTKVENEVGDADVCGVVTSLSPPKKSRSGSDYYVGEVCDGKRKLRFVGFSNSQQEKLHQFKEQKQPIELRNCQIKKSIRDSDKLEVLLKGSTKIIKSTKQFDVSPLEYNDDKPKDIELSELDTLPIHTIITTKVKVAKCGPPLSRGTKRKQDVIISDKTGTTVQLWEENLDLVQEGKSYILKAFRVAEYSNVKYLAMSRELSEILPTEDITDTVQLSPTHTATNSTSITIENPRIAAVYKLETIKMCIRCHSRVEPEAPPLGRCTKQGCYTLQDYTLCDSSKVAELLVLDDAANKITLYAFGDRIAQIAAIENPSEEQLLTASPISKIINKISD